MKNDDHTAPHPARPKLAGVVGWPVAHSLSPVIHQTWAAREGANAYYIPLGVEPSEAAFRIGVQHLRGLGFSGVNVTIPHKEHALKVADTASPLAQKAGAANMLSFVGDEIIADNSDVEGFYEALREKTSKGSTLKSALVLGAGGAARGVVLALQKAGIEKILVTNRTAARAESLCDDLGGEVLDWAARSDAVGQSDVVVNTTSLGMSGEPPLALDLSQLSGQSIVCDIVYAPLKTPLLEAAAAKNCACVDGLAMLMHQAVPGYRKWLGNQAMVDADLRQRLEAILTKRAKS